VVLDVGIEKVGFSIIDGDKVIKTFDGIQLTELENVTVFKAVIDWVDATLWMPDNPHLYVLKCRVNNQ
jgi:beta-galactosidase/beta-glucuronidase